MTTPTYKFFEIQTITSFSFGMSYESSLNLNKLTCTMMSQPVCKYEWHSIHLFTLSWKHFSVLPPRPRVEGGDTYNYYSPPPTTMSPKKMCIKNSREKKKVIFMELKNETIDKHEQSIRETCQCSTIKQLELFKVMQFCWKETPLKG